MHAVTTMMERQWRRSFASLLCLHAEQLFPHQSQIYPMPSKMLDLGLAACQNEIDPLDGDRELDRFSGKEEECCWSATYQQRPAGGLYHLPC